MLKAVNSVTQRQGAAAGRPLFPLLMHRRCSFTQSDPDLESSRGASALHESPHGRLAGPAAVDVAGIIDPDAFRGSGFG